MDEEYISKLMDCALKVEKCMIEEHEVLRYVSLHIACDFLDIELSVQRLISKLEELKEMR